MVELFFYILKIVVLRVAEKSLTTVGDRKIGNSDFAKCLTNFIIFARLNKTSNIISENTQNNIIIYKILPKK